MNCDCVIAAATATSLLRSMYPPCTYVLHERLTHAKFAWPYVASFLVLILSMCCSRCVSSDPRDVQGNTTQQSTGLANTVNV
jgi:hypothetical protein